MPLKCIETGVGLVSWLSFLNVLFCSFLTFNYIHTTATQSKLRHRKARPIDKAMTLDPRGLNRPDELLLLSYQSFSVMLHFKSFICNGGFISVRAFIFIF